MSPLATPFLNSIQVVLGIPRDWFSSNGSFLQFYRTYFLFSCFRLLKYHFMLLPMLQWAALPLKLTTGVLLMSVHFRMLKVPRSSQMILIKSSPTSREPSQSGQICDNNCPAGAIGKPLILYKNLNKSLTLDWMTLSSLIHSFNKYLFI